MILFLSQVVGFIVSMLQRACVGLEECGADSPVESQTLSMGMGLVATLLSGAAEVASVNIVTIVDMYLLHLITFV